MKYILLIEDDIDDQDFFRECLLQVDPDVTLTIASNGAEAIEKLENFVVRPDIIVCDINLPGIDGITLAGKIKECPNHGDIPIVLLSSTIPAQPVNFVQGAFKKPVSATEFCEIIEEVLIMI